MVQKRKDESASVPVFSSLFYAAMFHVRQPLIETNRSKIILNIQPLSRNKESRGDNAMEKSSILPSSSMTNHHQLTELLKIA